MAAAYKSTQKSSSPHKPYSSMAFMYGKTPLPVHEEHETDDDSSSSGGCSCFRIFCFEKTGGAGVGASGGGNGYLLQENTEYRETWVVKSLKKLKESSEIMAGPKWKNYVRKIGGYCSGNGNKKQKIRYQYDSESYALNFDNGCDRDEDDGFLMNSRLAAGYFNHQNSN